MTITALWRRLDVPGHDACRLVSDGGGWSLDGTAVFLHRGAPARLSYHLEGDRTWRTRHGTVRGFAGRRQIDVVVVGGRDGTWTLNGRTATGLDGCVHLDFSFTPATNFPHLRYLRLRERESADLPVAWLDLPCRALERLPQRYERRTRTTYWYEAPSVRYAAVLEVMRNGFVSRYPGLWEADMPRMPDRRRAPRRAR